MFVRVLGLDFGSTSHPKTTMLTIARWSRIVHLWRGFGSRRLRDEPAKRRSTKRERNSANERKIRGSFEKSGLMYNYRRGFAGDARHAIVKPISGRPRVPLLESIGIELRSAAAGHQYISSNAKRRGRSSDSRWLAAVDAANWKI